MPMSIPPISGGKTKSWFRNSLVLFQYAISVILISCTLIILKQMHVMKNRDLGFNKEQVLVLQINRDGVRKHFESFENRLILSGMNNSKNIYYPVPLPADPSWGNRV